MSSSRYRPFNRSAGPRTLNAATQWGLRTRPNRRLRRRGTALVLGHESAEEVVAVGDDVAAFEPGNCVTLEPGVPCRRCAHCKRGDYHLCESVRFMATPPHDGAFAEYVAWPADFAYELPNGVAAAARALCEPLSVGVHACRRGDVGPGDTVAGVGPSVCCRWRPRAPPVRRT